MAMIRDIHHLTMVHMIILQCAGGLSKWFPFPVLHF